MNNVLILESFKVANFKNFKEFNLEHLNNLTVLIGSNGVGKSNFLSIIDLISSAFHDGIDAYFQSKGISFQDCIHQWNLESKISLYLKFKDTLQSLSYSYQFTLEYEVNKGFKIIDEKFTLSDGTSKSYNNQDFTVLNLKGDFVLSTEEQFVKSFLSNVAGYSFYSTNLFSNNLQMVDKSNTKTLASNASNMASLLYLLKSQYTVSYKRIVDTLKLVVKSFEDFYFVEEKQGTILKFKMKDVKYPVSMKSLSDGTIRFIILSLLLNLPLSLRSSLVLLEEPEVSLHPLAIDILGDLIESYSQDSQIMVATQSPYILNRLNIENIYVLNFNVDSNETEIKHIDNGKLKEWLKKYSLGELWMMNLFGGGPL
ncbi:MAG: AAA family ATPase [Alphaproteobacteria bacterium]|nr:AAA family ATPase [Alphaproteobacteria bacterium]